MVQLCATNEVGLFCSTKATGTPHAFSRRKTLHVVAVASLPLSGMMSCLAPSPAVMSSLATSVTRSGLLATWWIFLVLPLVRRAPRRYLLARRSAVWASTVVSVAGFTSLLL